MHWLAHYWWLVAIANSAIGLLWVRSITYTRWWHKIIMIITGIPGFVVTFIVVLIIIPLSEQDW